MIHTEPFPSIGLRNLEPSPSTGYWTGSGSFSYTHIIQSPGIIGDKVDHMTTCGPCQRQQTETQNLDTGQSVVEGHA